MRTVEEILDRLKVMRTIDPGHGSDLALATELGLKKQAITNWRYRNQVAWKSLMGVLSTGEFKSLYHWAHEGDVESAGPTEIPHIPSSGRPVILPEHVKEAYQLIKDGLGKHRLPPSSEGYILGLMAEGVAQGNPRDYLLDRFASLVQMVVQQRRSQRQGK